ncbi:MAG: ketohexokinase, partial [Gammaproteobacteria bacterium]
MGVATLDIINRVAAYPGEDEEVRALAQARRVGGNAANTATVLAQLGDRASWAGNLGDCPEADRIRRHFDRYGVDHVLAHRVARGGVPTSCVTLSEATGSRTIVHWRDLPEYAAASFKAVYPGAFDWIHFEGRAVSELQAMVRHARTRSGRPVSLEVEKPREGIESLFDQVDVLFFSHHYLQVQGQEDPEVFLHGLPEGILATCTWGARGAWGRDGQGRILHQ